MSLTMDEVLDEKHQFSWIDYIVFGVMLVISCIIGIYFGFIERKDKRGVNDRRGSEALEYLVGGRNLKVFPVALSLVATFVSGISLLGTPTEIYMYGSQYVFILISVVMSCIIFYLIFLPVFYTLQITSAYEYLEMRFGKKIRLFGSVLFIIGIIVWLPIVVYVPALAFNQVSGVSIHLITPLVCAVCTFYTLIGGLKAVVWTDVLQTLIMIAAMILIVVKGTIEVGGLSVVWDRNFESGRLELLQMSFDPTTRYSFLSIIIGGTLYWISSGSVNQPMIQRYLAVPSLKHARYTVMIFVVGIICLLGLSMYCGFLIFALYHDCDPMMAGVIKARDQLLPLTVIKLLNPYPGFPGIFVAGVFSAALSSLSTALNSLSAVILEDFYKPFSSSPPTEKQTHYIMRISVFVMGVICILMVYVVEHMGDVLPISMGFGAICGGTNLGVFTAGVLIPWINEPGLLIGGVGGMISVAYLLYAAQHDKKTKNLPVENKPIYIHGCSNEFIAIAVSMPPDITLASDLPPVDNKEPVKDQKSIFNISYLLYTTYGSVITLVISFFASIPFGLNNPKDINQELLTPCIRRFITPRDSLSIRPDIKERSTVIHAFEIKENQLTTN